MQGKDFAALVSDPSSAGRALYAVVKGIPLDAGIPCSSDHSDTWPLPYCFAGATGLTGAINFLAFKVRGCFLLLCNHLRTATTTNFPAFKENGTPIPTTTTRSSPLTT